MSKKIFSILAVVLGAAFVGIAVYYWMTPAGALPAFVPGHIDGSTAIHVKHGIASLLLGLALFAYAWFAGGKNRQVQESNTNDTTPAATQ